jgi:O-antigen/teichoic acid export membrane protein
MEEEKQIAVKTNKVKAYRWLFYFSLAQTIVFFIVPAFMYPPKYLPYLEVMAALTLGPIFGLFFMAINIYGLFVDKQRRWLYIIAIILMSLWILWAGISWAYIEHMDYLLH